MKIIFTLLFCINSSVSFSQNLICKYTGFNCTEIKYKNLIKKNDLYFEKLKDYPFTGSSIGQKQGSIVNGKKNGLWKTYSSNEVLYMIEVWDNGLLLKTENL